MTENEKLTLIIAGYAAIISTVVLVWDVYKWWQTGPKIRVTVNTGMKIAGEIPPDPNLYVTASAVNVGDRATTITNLTLEYFDSWFSVMRRRPTKAFVVREPSTAQVVPYRFEPGARWVGVVPQDDEIEAMMRDGRLFIILSHAHGGGGVRVRLKPKLASNY